jgi:hypothetical protein
MNKRASTWGYGLDILAGLGTDYAKDIEPAPENPRTSH